MRRHIAILIILLVPAAIQAREELLWLGDGRFAHLRPTDEGLAIRFIDGQPRQTDVTHLHINESFGSASWDSTSGTLLVLSGVCEGPARIAAYDATGQRLYTVPVPEEHRFLLEPDGGRFCLTWNGWRCLPEIYDAATGTVIGEYDIPHDATIALPMGGDTMLIGVCGDKAASMHMIVRHDAKPIWEGLWPICPWSHYHPFQAHVDVLGRHGVLIADSEAASEGALVSFGLDQGHVTEYPHAGYHSGAKMLAGIGTLVVSDDPRYRPLAIVFENPRSQSLPAALVEMEDLVPIEVHRFLEPLPGLIMVHGSFRSATTHDLCTALLVDLRSWDSRSRPREPFTVHTFAGTVALDGEGRIWRIETRRSDGFAWWVLDQVGLPSHSDLHRTRSRPATR